MKAKIIIGKSTARIFMKIIFLGTSGGMPTGKRGSASVAIKRKGELILFDCGEGTQQKMVLAHLGFGGRMRIFISHLHGDHILGLPGLLQTMALLRREHPLYVYGPRGLMEFIKAFSSILGCPSFPLEVFEVLDNGMVFSGSEYIIEAVRADHEGESWSYALAELPRPGKFHPEKAKGLAIPEGPLWRRLQHGEDVKLGDKIVKSAEVVEPQRIGSKIVYSGDTRPNEELVRMAKRADLLIHEATFNDDMEDRAKEDGHSTASQAAEIARAAEVTKLVLTHLSSRYPDPEPMLINARKIFPETQVAEDLMELNIQA